MFYDKYTYNLREVNLTDSLRIKFSSGFDALINHPSILTFPHLKDVSSQKSITPAQELQKHIDNTPYSRLCF